MDSQIKTKLCHHNINNTNKYNITDNKVKVT